MQLCAHGWVYKQVPSSLRKPNTNVRAWMDVLSAGVFSFPFPFVSHTALIPVPVPVRPAHRTRSRSRSRSSRTSQASSIRFRTSAQFCKFVKNVRFCLFLISL